MAINTGAFEKRIRDVVSQTRDIRVPPSGAWWHPGPSISRSSIEAVHALGKYLKRYLPTPY